ncbi:RidA family protein [Thorsellia anophelis]|uniref:2-iminobutanoate/2-iminopropanoate deaminase n=1 Tax=Thorsellia anophelis DSM 18579 TaxID=1123402 RepID=A0A1I0AAP6_9GAMM|nr:RidA family protein [Thorsellia anophelis]SES91266.1 2-iminobutanoate/2-iminopropanoate deaminase [Thorsellia anophelis DSM 18579]
MKAIQTTGAPAAIGPYVQAVDIGSLVFTSGQIPVNPKTGEIPDTIILQTQQALENVKAIITQAGLNVSNIIKMTVFIKNMEDFAEINTVYESFFIDNQSGFPARSCVEVARLPKDVLIEIEAIAVRV